MKTTSSAATSSRVGWNDSPSTISLSARLLEHRERLLARGDVAGRDHRDVDALDELCREPVVGFARVHLLRRPRMERQGGRSGLDEPRPELEARARAVFDAAPHLDGHGNLDGRGDRLHDSAGELRILHQVGARAGLRHLAHRAAEVHVDDVCAGRLDHPRRIRHRMGIRAEDLDRERVLVGRDAQVAEGPLVAVLDPGCGDHLRADQTGAETASLAPKSLDADPRHRRQHDPGGDLDAADRPRLLEVHRHRTRVSAVY